MKHKLLLLYAWFVRTLMYFFPDIPFIMRIRGYLYNLGMPTPAKNLQVSATAIIKNLENCFFNDDVYLAPFVVVNAIDKITLEKQVMIGFSSVLVSGNHSAVNGSFRFGDSIKSPIVVGLGEWVGANCTLTAGSLLPTGSLLAANSVISKIQVREFAIYGGVPAKCIGSVKS